MSQTANFNESPRSAEQFIFVYGTLKTGFCRNHYLREFELLGEFQTLPIYRLFDCGSYPGLVLDRANGRSILGEVWTIDESGLAVLDQVEGVDEGLYQRATVELSANGSKKIPAAPVLVYLYRQSVAGLLDCGQSWPAGVDRSR